MGILNFSQPATGNFLVDIIAWLIKISSSIAVGVVLFTVLLKLITLPFDYVSRASMRKNSLKMEEMRPELEKLQQQYANDKALYNQKMMALYKKNGYSMFGACLPTILTLVIFIVAINAFTSYSQYQNKLYFYNMSKAYNNVIYSGFELDESQSKYITRGVNEELIINGNSLYELYVDGGEQTQNTVKGTKKDNSQFDINFDVTVGATTDIKNKEEVTIGQTTAHQMVVYTENGFIKATLNFDKNVYNQVGKDAGKVDGISFSSTYYNVIETKLDSNELASEENNFLLYYPVDENGNILLDSNGEKIKWDYATAKLKYTPEYFNTVYKKQIDSANEEIKKLQDKGEDYSHIKVPTYSPLTAEEFLQDIRQQKSADKYREEEASFLWVKNIWVTDSPMSHPVASSWSDFKNSHGYDGFDIKEEGYGNLTKKLTYEKDAPNGYFILVILTAGSSLLTQLVMSKSQKAQMELQTVDGKGAQTQKVMMIMMPIMMAVFAFMYTSAFSIYIILSSLISMGSTLGINKIVDYKFKKQNANKEKDTKRIRGRVYTPKQEEIKEEPKKDKKKKKGQENAHGDNDFMSGKADGKKHVRGRLK